MGLARRLYEVAENGAPARGAGLTIEIARCLDGGLELLLHCPEGLEAGVLILGAERHGRLAWGALEVQEIRPLGGERFVVRAALDRGPGGFFAPARLTPTFDPGLMRFQRPAIGDVARAWVELGVLREVPLDRVLVCPRCHSLPTFRYGCRHCGGARVDSQRMIHHFPCAHVGFLQDFQVDGLLLCPKCSARALVVNADFEYLDGPFVCVDCKAADSESETIGHCFGCSLRFLSRLAMTLELVGFDADRLDTLDLQLPT